MSIIIRKYQSSDKPKVVQLMNVLQDFFVEIDSERELKSFDSPKKTEEYIDQAIKDASKMSGAVFVAINEGGEVVGFVQGIINGHKNDIMHNLSHNQGKDGWIGLM